MHVIWLYSLKKKGSPRVVVMDIFKLIKLERWAYETLN